MYYKVFYVIDTGMLKITWKEILKTANGED